MGQGPRPEPWVTQVWIGSSCPHCGHKHWAGSQEMPLNSLSQNILKGFLILAFHLFVHSLIPKSFMDRWLCASL